MFVGCCFFFQAEDGIRDYKVTGVQTCALPICTWWSLIFSAPTRMYGMRQSAQATPERAWMPWFHISNSGCCALRTGAPLRSEERRVGKECRARGAAEREKEETRGERGYARHAE